MRRRVLFIANSLDNAYKFQQVLSRLDIEVAAASIAQMKKILEQDPAPSLVIYEAYASAFGYLDQVEELAESHKCALLVIADEPDVERLRLPADASHDFVLGDADPEECRARVKRLLAGGEARTKADLIEIEEMSMNLATYQVSVSGEPVDFTYLEYALLVFLVQNAGHTFSRDTLLKNVWGFDYYGGSRTVDVHVRRIRSKLGPSLAQHLTTIRGVGYLWDSRSA